MSISLDVSAVPSFVADASSSGVSAEPNVQPDIPAIRATTTSAIFTPLIIFLSEWNAEKRRPPMYV
jgi:hypothetical protein